MGFHFTIIALFLTEQEQTSNITESLQLRCSVPRNQPVFSQSEKGQYQSRFIAHTAFHALDTMILQLSFPTSHFCLFPPSEYTIDIVTIPAYHSETYYGTSDTVPYNEIQQSTRTCMNIAQKGISLYTTTV